MLNNLVLDHRSGRHESPYRAADVVVQDDAITAVQLLRGTNALLVVVSNQPAAAKGTTSLDDLAEVDRAVMEAFARGGIAFDLVAYCFHHPDGTVPGLAGPCQCRKPAPGLLSHAIETFGVGTPSSTWMIGDSDVDVAAGQAVGATTILIEEALSLHRRTGSVDPDHRVPSLLSAAELVCARLGDPATGDT